MTTLICLCPSDVGPGFYVVIVFTHHIQHVNMCAQPVSFLVFPPAQQGETLLWHGWLEKHPDTRSSSDSHPETVTAPWDDPDTRAAWDRHAAETYRCYWEQYTYWADQGWTTDYADVTGPVEGEGAVAVDPGTGGGVEGEQRGEEIDRVDWWDGEVNVKKSGLENETRERREGTGFSDSKGSEALIGQAYLEAGTRDLIDLIGQMSFHSEGADQCDVSKQQGEVVCGTDEPCDGGNDRKRASSSSDCKTSETTGNSRSLYATEGISTDWGL